MSDLIHICLEGYRDKNKIEYAFTFGNPKELNKLFGTDISVHTGKINNKKIIAKMAQHINSKKFF